MDDRTPAKFICSPECLRAFAAQASNDPNGPPAREGGRVFGKPGSVAGAVEQLSAMAGQAHDLITALVVVQGDRIFDHTNVTRLRMRRLSHGEIERYVAADQPLDCAGAYKLESRGIVLFEKIDSDDQTAVTGLPLIALVTILRDLGYEVP